MVDLLRYVCPYVCGYVCVLMVVGIGLFIMVIVTNVVGLEGYYFFVIRLLVCMVRKAIFWYIIHHCHHYIRMVAWGWWRKPGGFKYDVQINWSQPGSLMLLRLTQFCMAVCNGNFPGHLYQWETRYNM